LIKIGRFEPSSGLCSICGNIKHDLKLSEHAYHYDARGFTIDRDLNPHSINIMKLGLMKVGEGIPEHTPVEMPLAGCLNRDGISRVSLNQEPPMLQGGEDARNILISLGPSVTQRAATIKLRFLAWERMP